MSELAVSLFRASARNNRLLGAGLLLLLNLRRVGTRAVGARRGRR